jgi:hypothetical protein
VVCARRSVSELIDGVTTRSTIDEPACRLRAQGLRRSRPDSCLAHLYDGLKRRGASVATATINSSGSIGFTRCI